MKSALISVGTEILFGEIVNTNVVYLSQGLNALGIGVLYHYTVGDNDSRLREILELALSDCDLVLTTGGLGPTEDDMTKETVASVMGDYLEEHKASRQALEARFMMRLYETDDRIAQAYLIRLPGDSSAKICILRAICLQLFIQYSLQFSFQRRCGCTQVSARGITQNGKIIRIDLIFRRFCSQVPDRQQQVQLRSRVVIRAQPVTEHKRTIPKLLKCLGGSHAFQ